MLMVPVFISRGTSFYLLFQTFPNFCGRMCGLGFFSVRFRFTKLQLSVVQATAHFSCICVMLQAMDE